MTEKNNNNKRKLSLLILREAIWGLEDKINVILESIADHEADLIRIKRLNNLILQRLEALESLNKHRRKK